MHDRRPALIARCESPEDVAAAIAYGRERDLPIAVRGGGHSLPGFSTVDGGIVIDLRALNHVDRRPGRQARPRRRRRPPRRRRPRRPGPRPRRPRRRRLAHRRRRPDPRRRRRPADATLRADDRLARVRRRSCSPTAGSSAPADDEHADLFWGLRGGGGNFGVVTEFEFRAHELSVLPILATFHPLDRAAEVLNMGERHMSDTGRPRRAAVDELHAPRPRRGPVDDRRRSRAHPGSCR